MQNLLDHFIPNSVNLGDQVQTAIDRKVTGLIKTTGNIRIYHPHVFHVGYGPNQSYDLGCDWERLSPSPTRKVKGRTPESI